MDRPPCLPVPVRHAIEAMATLTWPEKAVWLATQELDNGPEGAWISDDSLGKRIGLAPSTIHNIRAKLRRLGLLMSLPRPGGRQVGWVALCPVEWTGCRAGPRAEQVAAALDRISSSTIIVSEEVRSSYLTGYDSSDSSSDSSVVAGKDPAVVFHSEAILPLAVSKLQGGEVPNGTKEKRKSNRRPSHPEQEEITLLTKHDGGAPEPTVTVPAPAGVEGIGPGSDWQRMKEAAKRFNHDPPEQVERQA